MHSARPKGNDHSAIQCNASGLRIADGDDRPGDTANKIIGVCPDTLGLYGARAAAKSVGRACIYALHMDLHTASRMLALAERQCNRTNMDLGTRSLADLVSALFHWANDHGSRSLSLATAILQRPGDPVTDYATAVLRRASYWLMGDIHAFDTIGRAAPPPGRSRRASLATLVDRSVEAAVNLQQLRLPMAARLSRDVLAARPRGGCSTAVFVLPAVILAQLAYERGDLVEADAAVRAVLPCVRSRGTVEAAVRAYTTLARAAIRRGRCEFAAMILREGETLGGQRGWPRLTSACLAERVDLLCTLGRNEDARSVFAKLVLLHRPYQNHGKGGGGVALHLELSRCRIDASASRLDMQVRSIRPLLSEALSRGDLLLGTELAVRLIAALVRAGDEQAASELMMKIVEVGCEVGLHQTILDGEAEVRQILRAILPTLAVQYLKAYVATLLEHWPDTPARNSLKMGEKRSEGVLTPRERNVLQLMSLGHSNKRIAQGLGIAPETVKSHAKNIFVRLGSATRTEAVSRAASLGMI